MVKYGKYKIIDFWEWPIVVDNFLFLYSRLLSFYFYFLLYHIEISYLRLSTFV